MTDVDLRGDLEALGVLLGLLTTTADGAIEPSAAWFQDPKAALRPTRERISALDRLLADLLGAPAQVAALPGSSWYALPNSGLGTTTAVHLVVPAPAAATAEFGLGVLLPVEIGALTVTSYGYLPIIAVDDQETLHLIGRAGYGTLQAGLDIRAVQPLTVGTESFTGVSVEAQMGLATGAASARLVWTGAPGWPAITAWGDLLADDVSKRFDALLAPRPSWLDAYVPGTMTTVGELLCDAGVLSLATASPPPDGYPPYAVDIKQLAARKPMDVALGAAFAVLDALASSGPLLELPGGGIYIDHDAQRSSYGLRVAGALDLSGAPDSASAPPGVTLCLGRWMSGEDDSRNWMQRAGAEPAGPGLALRLLRRAADNSVSLAPGLGVVSVGLDLAGGAGSPLIEAGGFTLGGAEARLSIDSSDWSAPSFAVRLDGVGFPLGPPTGGDDAAGNPVAGALVSSGASDASREPVNPAFSAQAQWLVGRAPVFELLDPSGADTDVVWFPVQRRFGPLACSRVGVGMAGSDVDRALAIRLDGGVALAGLDVELDGLQVAVPLHSPLDPTRYTLDLDGLAIAFAAGDVEISGGLLRTKAPDGTISYDGEAVIKTPTIALFAIGSFAELAGGGVSLFVFAWLDAPIGGPPCFSITGLCAGFGYNRALKVPTQDQVGAFPLVAGLADTAKLGGAGGGRPAPGHALEALERDQVVPIERGEYWLAAGVQFTTFEIVKSVALLFVEFGQELIVGVVGTSTLRQPQEGEPWVYAELDVVASLRPQRGELLVAAVIAPGSYVVTQAAHLTGGFALGAWFGPNPHAGDFVLTLGGYHPAFVPPAHYPVEPRVGITATLSDFVTVVGEAYFAITPSAGMAGADFAFTFAEGPLKAWLKAQADVLVDWKPFYVVATLSVHIGVSLRVQLGSTEVTLSVEVGADLQLWGPPIGFKAHVDCYVVSFTIGSGQPSPPEPLTWEQFKGLLPAKPTTTATAATAVTESADAIVRVGAVDGLTRAVDQDGFAHWLFRSASLRLDISSAIAATKIQVEGSAGDIDLDGCAVALRDVDGGVPAERYASTQTVTVMRMSAPGDEHVRARLLPSSACTTRPEVGGAPITDPAVDLTGWQITPSEQALPKAMWGSPLASGSDPLKADGDTPTTKATVGVSLVPESAPSAGSPVMSIDAVFGERTINEEDEGRLPLGSAAPPPPTWVPSAAPTLADIEHMNDAASRRADLIDALAALGVALDVDLLPAPDASAWSGTVDQPLAGTPIPAMAGASRA